MHVKKGDSVVVLSGKDKGKTGTVERAFPKLNTVIVSGVNLKKKHQKGKRGGQKGQVVEKPFPIHASNVAKSEKKSTRAAKAK